MGQVGPKSSGMALCPLSPLPPSFPGDILFCRGSASKPCLMEGRGPLQHVGLSPQPLFLLSHPTAPCRDVSSVLSPVACDCNPDGSALGPEGCDPSTGQCHCLPDVMGRTCGLCQPGYYGLQPTVGCKRCVGHDKRGSRGSAPAPCLCCLLIALRSLVPAASATRRGRGTAGATR